MKFSKELMKKAHDLTKEIKAEFPGVDYKFQFGICLKYLLSNKEDTDMVQLKGSEKQIAWAEKIRAEKLADWEKEKVEMEGKHNQKYIQDFTEAAERILSIENASNWIDLKDRSLTALVMADMKKKLYLYCIDIAEEKAFKDRY